jgi:hypothetical protein
MTVDEKTENFSTSCKNCIFAQWENGVQVDNGCDLGRLEKYNQQNKVKTHEDGYFIIDTVCNTCRGESWANRNVGKNLISLVNDEIKITLDFVLLATEEKDIYKKLPDLINQCVKQKMILPKKIFIVIPKHVNAIPIYNMLQEEFSETQHEIIKIVDEKCSELECIDIAIKRVKSRYYAIFDLSSKIPVNLIQVLNELINTHLKSLSMVKPFYKNNGLILQTTLHRIFGGNKNAPIHEKITEVSIIQQKTENVYEWEDLWKRQ